MQNVLQALEAFGAKPVTVNGAIVQNEEVQKLKLKAIAAYSEDGGTMYECTDSAEYVSLIETFGSAAKAWEHHIKIEGARFEGQAGYDAY